MTNGRAEPPCGQTGDRHTVLSFLSFFVLNSDISILFVQICPHLKVRLDATNGLAPSSLEPRPATPTVQRVTTGETSAPAHFLQAFCDTKQFTFLAGTLWERGRENHETESPGANSHLSWKAISVLLVGNINIYNTHLCDTFPRCTKPGQRKVRLL